MKLTQEQFAEYLRNNEGAEYLVEGTSFWFSLHTAPEDDFPYSIRFASDQWRETTRRGAPEIEWPGWDGWMGRTGSCPAHNGWDGRDYVYTHSPVHPSNHVSLPRISTDPVRPIPHPRSHSH